jgi:hypothetical protein
MNIRLTAAQADTLRDYLDTADLNTVQVSQARPYEDIIIRRYSPRFTDAVRINGRGEWLGDVEPPRVFNRAEHVPELVRA